MTELMPQKVKISSTLKTCEKCGNLMVNRVIIIKNGKGIKERQKIYQCIVCRHWIPKK
ncbi:MAG: hypothetical protein ACTSU4_13785 [Promethearchaeota archaeon]